MKKLLDLPVLSVFEELDRVPVPTPITVEKGLHYLMFMQAISTDLEANGNQPNLIMLEHIEDVAKEHGGAVIYDLSQVEDGTLVALMLHNSSQGMLFTRLTYLTARLLADKDSQ